MSFKNCSRCRRIVMDGDTSLGEGVFIDGRYVCGACWALEIGQNSRKYVTNAEVAINKTGLFVGSVVALLAVIILISIIVFRGSSSSNIMHFPAEYDAAFWDSQQGEQLLDKIEFYLNSDTFPFTEDYEDLVAIRDSSEICSHIQEDIGDSFYAVGFNCIGRNRQGKVEEVRCIAFVKFSRVDQIVSGVIKHDWLAKEMDVAYKAWIEKVIFYRTSPVFEERGEIRIVKFDINPSGKSFALQAKVSVVNKYGNRVILNLSAKVELDHRTHPFWFADVDFENEDSK